MAAAAVPPPGIPPEHPPPVCGNAKDYHQQYGQENNASYHLPVSRGRILSRRPHITTIRPLPPDLPQSRPMPPGLWYSNPVLLGGILSIRSS